MFQRHPTFKGLSDAFGQAGRRRFWLGDQEFELSLGTYEGGRLGVTITYVGRVGDPSEKDPIPGEQWGKLTVNLPDEPLGSGEVHVKLDLEDRARGRLLSAVEELGLFERTGRFVRAGFVERYAEVWRWVPPAPGHVAELDSRHERGRETRRAADTIKRAGGNRRRS